MQIMGLDAPVPGWRILDNAVTKWFKSKKSIYKDLSKEGKGLFKLVIRVCGIILFLFFTYTFIKGMHVRYMDDKKNMTTAISKNDSLLKKTDTSQALIIKMLDGMSTKINNIDTNVSDIKKRIERLENIHLR
jgi:hypothetical protein